MAGFELEFPFLFSYIRDLQKRNNSYGIDFYMNPKQVAGEKSVEWVKSGMKVGLGTGSTAFFMVKKLGELVRNGLDIQGIATSDATEKLAKEEGIPLLTLAEIDRLDVTIDGADEFTDDLALIKGGGGALYREKMIASISQELIIITDASKHVQDLGAFPLPVEVVPFGREITQKRIEALGGTTQLRSSSTGPYVTDNGNNIFDCNFGAIKSPEKLDMQLKKLLGVVETGLFVGMATRIILAHSSGKIQMWEKS